MGRAYDQHIVNRATHINFVRKSIEKRLLKRLGEQRRIILKWILEKQDIGARGQLQLTQDCIIVADCCKYDNGTRGSTKCVELWLRNRCLHRVLYFHTVQGTKQKHSFSVQAKFAVNTRQLLHSDDVREDYCSVTGVTQVLWSFHRQVLRAKTLTNRSNGSLVR